MASFKFFSFAVSSVGLDIDASARSVEVKRSWATSSHDGIIELLGFTASLSGPSRGVLGPLMAPLRRSNLRLGCSSSRSRFLPLILSSTAPLPTWQWGERRRARLPSGNPFRLNACHLCLWQRLFRVSGSCCALCHGLAPPDSAAPGSGLVHEGVFLGPCLVPCGGPGGGIACSSPEGGGPEGGRNGTLPCWGSQPIYGAGRRTWEVGTQTWGRGGPPVCDNGLAVPDLAVAWRPNAPRGCWLIGAVGPPFPPT